MYVSVSLLAIVVYYDADSLSLGLDSMLTVKCIFHDIIWRVWGMLMNEFCLPRV